jgi:magnesium chelatase family protein
LTAGCRQLPGGLTKQLSLDLSVEENLNFFAHVFGTTIEQNYHLIKDIYQQLEPFKTRKAGKLSGGMKQKLALCCALIHEPSVLFLDELPEFKRTVLEVLRQPMETHQMTISRSRFTVEYPANFMLVASMNPCPCGYYTHPEKECVCPPVSVQKYLNKISGPLMDRIDLHVEVEPVNFDTMASDEIVAESSESVRQRVLRAREIQMERFKEYPDIFCNAQMTTKLIQEFCQLDKIGTLLLKKAMNFHQLSARAYDRILKVARTIADLHESEKIETEHIALAVQFRNLDKSGIS